MPKVDSLSQRSFPMLGKRVRSLNPGKILIVLLALLGDCIILFAENQTLTDEAQAIFNAQKANVFQIRVIDLSSGEKSVLGSGFIFTTDGHIATNYHVVSEAVHKPHQYRIEYLDDSGESGDLMLWDVDIIHDVAILKSQRRHNSFLSLGQSNLSKGTRVFSMGNPHDLGMSIIEGTYNGLMEKTQYPQILFSGAINAGMSGGPAINHEGQVIGLNVAWGGDDLSFLVPVEYLKNLYQHVLNQTTSPLSQKNKYIEEQILKHEDGFLTEILNAQWKKMPLGETVVPGELTDIFKCWGNTEDEEHMYYIESSLNCFMDSDIWVSKNIQTGDISFSSTWLISKKLNPIRFYNLGETYMSPSYRWNFFHFGKDTKKEDLTNYACQVSFIDLGGRDWKVAFCSRQYKKYPQLYDMTFTMVSLSEMNRILVVKLNAQGLRKENSLALVNKFMREIKWPK